jgi:hypothetical protein
MAEHPSIRSRSDNVAFVRFKRRAMPVSASVPAARTCRSCAHWYGEDDGHGQCLADCGARTTPAQGSCPQWRRPPLLTVV